MEPGIANRLMPERRSGPRKTSMVWLMVRSLKIDYMAHKGEPCAWDWTYHAVATYEDVRVSRFARWIASCR